MKTTDRFKEVIKKHLEEVSEQEALFREKFENPNKNLDDCIKYILNTVQKSGCNGFEDDEIFNMARHYYDEEEIDVGKDIDMRVVINHTVQLTEEEIEEAKEKAKKDVIREQREKMLKKPVKKATQTVVKKEESDEPLTLF